MRENDPAPAFGDDAGDVAEDVADRRARAARIRQRSRELIEALGADHPLVAEALARADELDADPGDAAGTDAPGATHRGEPGSIDLRSSAESAR